MSRTAQAQGAKNPVRWFLDIAAKYQETRRRVNVLQRLRHKSTHKKEWGAAMAANRAAYKEYTDALDVMQELGDDVTL